MEFEHMGHDVTKAEDALRLIYTALPEERGLALQEQLREVMAYMARHSFPDTAIMRISVN